MTFTIDTAVLAALAANVGALLTNIVRFGKLQQVVEDNTRRINVVEAKCDDAKERLAHLEGVIST